VLDPSLWVVASSSVPASSFDMVPSFAGGLESGPGLLPSAVGGTVASDDVPPSDDSGVSVKSPRMPAHPVVRAVTRASADQA
jgi:hypothetical protein